MSDHCFDMKQLQLFMEVLAERNRQDAEHGGPSHDDTHSPMDWCRFIEERNHSCYSSFCEQRYAFVQIAALAFAALESADRLAARAIGLPGPVDTRPSGPDFSEGA